MDRDASLESAAGRLAGVPAERVVLRCRHGTSSAFVLPGPDQAANLIALDMLRARHSVRNRCACLEVAGRSGLLQ